MTIRDTSRHFYLREKGLLHVPRGSSTTSFRIVVQGLFSVAVMVLVLTLLTRGTGGRFERWMLASPLRARVITAFCFIGSGTFLIFYWGVRSFASHGIGWFPHF